ncbi:MAG: radical SAM protein [Anaerolineae bacterium]|nr:radical SAM protein [Anaerolineae bacterium]
MNKLPIPEPFSGGIFLSYKCTNTCKHCMYACSPQWPADWISPEDAGLILAQLADKMRGKYPHPGRVGVNEGIHFTGGEPFLNFDLLLQLTETARRLGVPTTFVETNAFWCRDDKVTREKLTRLKAAGLDGILISANPFILEQIPFERTERAVRISREVFGDNAIVYQRFFYEQFKALGLRGTLAFEEYLARAGWGLQYVELFASGRVPYKLAALYARYPASRFLGASCRRELIRDWHIHVDNYGNFIPGYCGGLSLGDARDLDAICRGINLDERPVLAALLTNLGELYRLGQQFGYQEQAGYISKCHLCLDIRRHLARQGDFKELKPEAFYEHLA